MSNGITQGTIQALQNSLVSLKLALDQTLITLETQGFNHLRDQVRSYYPMVEYQMQLVDKLRKSCSLIHGCPTDEDMEMVDSISNKINAISRMIKEESLELVAEITTGVKSEKMYH